MCYVCCSQCHEESHVWFIWCNVKRLTDNKQRHYTTDVARPLIWDFSVISFDFHNFYVTDAAWQISRHLHNFEIDYYVFMNIARSAVVKWRWHFLNFWLCPLTWAFIGFRSTHDKWVPKFTTLNGMYECCYTFSHFSGKLSLSRTGNEYHPKCRDALWLGSKGSYGSFHLWINMWMAGKTDPSLSRTIPERFRDESL